MPGEPNAAPSSGASPYQKGRQFTLSEQLAIAQATINRLKADTRRLEKANDEQRRSNEEERRSAEKRVQHIKEGFEDSITHLKKKHHAEVQTLNHEINTLTNLVKAFRQGPGGPGFRDLQEYMDDAAPPRKRTRLATQSTHPLLSGVPSVPQPGEFAPSNGLSSGPANTDSPARPARKPEAFPICIYCYMNDLSCDPGEPCTNCEEKNRNCKRAKCKNFKGGACGNAKCLRAHEEDLNRYENICAAGHVRKNNKKVGNKDDKNVKKGGDDGAGGDSRDTKLQAS